MATIHPSPTTSTRSLLKPGRVTRYLLFRLCSVSSAILPLDARKAARSAAFLQWVGRGGVRLTIANCSPSAPPTHHNTRRSLRLIWLLYLRVVGLCGFHISLEVAASEHTYPTARGVHDMCDLRPSESCPRAASAASDAGQAGPQGPKQVRISPRACLLLVHIRATQPTTTSIDHAARQNRHELPPRMAWLSERAYVRFGCGATVAPRCMPSTYAGCHVFRGAAFLLATHSHNKRWPVAVTTGWYFHGRGNDGRPRSPD